MGRRHLTATGRDRGVRYVARRDLHDMVGIEVATYAEPWQREDFARALRGPFVTGMVAVSREDMVIGHAIFRLLADRVEILNLTADPFLPRTGIGRLLWGSVRSHLCPGRRERAEAVVDEALLPGAALFFKAMGFRAEGLERGRFGSRDGVLMAYDIRRGGSA